jgi:hypothetical protein
MSLIVLLDAGPLGMITNPKSSPENEACKNWLASLAYNSVEVVIPEIADYEVRRELLRLSIEFSGLASCSCRYSLHWPGSSHLISRPMDKRVWMSCWSR